jgi:hypothetical protein
MIVYNGYATRIRWNGAATYSVERYTITGWTHDQTFIDWTAVSMVEAVRTARRWIVDNVWT